MKPQHKPATSGRRLHEARRPPSSQFLLNEKYFSTLNIFLGFCHDEDLKVFRSGDPQLRPASTFSRLCGAVSLPSESERQRAAPRAPGGVATPPHLPPHSGPHVEAADAAGRRPPLGGVPVLPAPRRQTRQPGWTAAVKILPEQQRLACLTVLSVASLQLEEAQRKHDLLVELLHKDQEHKRRLVSPSTAFARARAHARTQPSLL